MGGKHAYKELHGVGYHATCLAHYFICLSSINAWLVLKNSLYCFSCDLQVENVHSKQNSVGKTLILLISLMEPTSLLVIGYNISNPGVVE